MKKISFVVTALLWLAMSGTPTEAITINVTGGLGDLDGNGSALNEQGVLNRSVGLWSSLILTNRTFTLNVNSASITALGFGGISTFNAANIPTSGSITLATNANWFVDNTPGDNSEFTRHADFDSNHNHFNLGPAGGRIDLLTVVNQEIGHSLGWHAAPAAGSAGPHFNPLFVALMDPEPLNFTLGTTVFLSSPSYNAPLAGDGIPGDVVNELSHTANFGDVPGWLGTNMSRNMPLLDGGFANRLLPGDADFRMFEAAYADTVVPEPSTLLLLGSSLAGLGGFAWRRQRRK